MKDDPNLASPAGASQNPGKPLRRKEVLQLFGVAAIGWGVSQFLRETVPIGADVRGNAAASAVLNDADAPTGLATKADLSMAVFTDYLCPICRVTDAAMMEAVGKDAGVRLLYKDWPILSEASARSARIALASQKQGIYQRFHTGLMQERGMLDDRVLRRVLEASGGNWEGALHDLDADAPSIERRLSRNRLEAFSLGLSGTPAFLIGGLLVNRGLSEREFREVFARARALA